MAQYHNTLILQYETWNIDYSESLVVEVKKHLVKMSTIINRMPRLTKPSRTRWSVRWVITMWWSTGWRFTTSCDTGWQMWLGRIVRWFPTPVSWRRLTTRWSGRRIAFNRMAPSLSSTHWFVGSYSDVTLTSLAIAFSGKFEPILDFLLDHVVGGLRSQRILLHSFY